MSAPEPAAKGAARPVRVFSLAVLGGLTALRIEPSAGVVLLGALSGIIFGGIAIAVMRGLLSAGNPGLRATYGETVIDAAVAGGFLMLLPFAVLALLAELLLQWEAVQAFMATGLMTAAALTGSELSALGGRPIYNAVMPALLMAALAAGWMILSALAAGWLQS